MEKEIEKYKNNLKFEHDLINRRLTWLFNSQTILIAVAVFANKADGTNRTYSNILDYLPFLGLFSCLAIFIGIMAGVIAKYLIWKDYKEKTDPNEQWGVRTRITKMAVSLDLLLPIIFLSLWLLIVLGGK
jgi:hypothetical protein